MLYSTIRDMQNVIKDHQSKVFKDESRAGSAEENCIILKEELNFLRIGLKNIEESVRREKKAKTRTAKDIAYRNAGKSL